MSRDPTPPPVPAVRRAAPRRWRRKISQVVARWLPPARLTWIALLALGVYGAVELLPTMALASLMLLPTVAVIVDVVFQTIRFETRRFPDAALATGAFLALLLPPTVILSEAIVVTVAAIALRHILRTRGRPWFNPAAVGVVIGAVLFGMAPAWWVAIGTSGEVLMLGLGVLVTVRSWRDWRIPVSFLVAFAGLATIYHFLFGGAVSPAVLFLSVLDPTTLFFALFMVPEPRTAPTDHAAQPLFAVVVAVLAVFSPLLFPTLGLLLGLLIGNLFTIVLRARLARTTTVAAIRPSSRRGTASKARAVAARWSAARRLAAGMFVLVFLGVAAGASLGPSATPSSLVVSGPPPSTGSSVSLTGCTTDTTSVSSSTLSLLHSELGPSVILSYNSNSGVVVFYDPVNHVTVTETDLYEDHGFAEFNGDDYAVNGCAP